MGNISWSKREEHKENPHAESAESHGTMSPLQESNMEIPLQCTNEKNKTPSFMENTIPQENISLETFQQMSENLMRTHQDKLHQSRKLVLMVDLDNTLIHTTETPCQCSPKKNIFEMKLEGSPTYYVRLRPYYKEFLEKISELYELSIFTFACKSYAKTVAGFLDPDKTFFAQRIISRDDCFYSSSKMANVRFFSPCGESMICMIDDREDVWNFAPGLVAVKPYTYFKNQTPSDSHFWMNTEKDEAGQDGEDNDDYLLYLEEVLKRIHAEYYRRYEAYLRKEVSESPDVSKVVPELRSKTLEGTTIVFSGIAPQSHFMPEYHCAKALGARIEQKVVLSFENANWTTHLISTKIRTKKVLRARTDQNMHIVSPCWLWCCWYRWEKAEEVLFSLEDYVPQQAKRRKYVFRPDTTHDEQVADPPTEIMKHISWIFDQRQDLVETLNLSANPKCPQQSNTVQPSNNYEQPQHQGVKQKRSQTKDENSSLSEGEEMLVKKPRLEEPLSMGGSESQGRRSNEVQGTADQPRQGPESEQPSTGSRRASRRHWYRYIRRRWSKRKAQNTRAQPRTDSWMQKPSQITEHSHRSPALYQSPFCVSQEPQGPRSRDFLTFGYSTQMNQQRSESGFRRPLQRYHTTGFRRPLLQDHSTGFSQPMQILPLLDQEYRRPVPQYPPRPWQQQTPLAGPQTPPHPNYLRRHPVQMQHQNCTLRGWRGPSGAM